MTPKLINAQWGVGSSLDKLLGRNQASTRINFNAPGTGPDVPLTGLGGSGGSSVDDLLAALGIDLNGGGIGSSSSWSATPVVPPVVDLLGEMRARRSAEAEQAGTIASILGANIPAAMENYPGFEMGGLADVLLGIITGNGPAAAQQVLPQSQRRVNRVGIPVPAEGQPGVEEDVGTANALAQQILDAIRVISTGGSSSGG